MKRPFNKSDLLIAALVSLLFVLFASMGLSAFETLERFIYAVHMRLDLPRSSGENRIAIVNIDDKSVDQLGPWPWPRQLIAEMIQILTSNGAKLIGLDIVFSQKEQNQGLDEITKLQKELLARQGEAGDKGNQAWLIERLDEIKRRLDSDMKLSETVRRSGNIILPVVGKFGQYDTELVIPGDPFLKRSSLGSVHLGKDLERYASVSQLTAPFAELSDGSLGLGHINLSPNEIMTGEMHLPFINFRGHTIPSMPLRLALDYLNKHPKQVIVLKDKIQMDQELIPTSNGEIFIRFKGARKSFPTYSFADILRVKKVPAVFADKIVLIGVTAREGGISVKTPVDPKMPRVELIANVIDDFMTGRYLKRPEALPYAEAALILIIGMLAALVLPGSNYFSRTAICAGALFLIFTTGTFFFMALDIWFKITYISLTVVTLYFVFSIKDLVLKEKSLERTSKESIETNRMLGLSLQSQGMLDLAFEKLRKCPLDDAMKDVLYNLGLDFERKRMLNKAVSVYEYITRHGKENFRDLRDRIAKLRKLSGTLPLGTPQGRREEKILLSDDLEVKPTIGRYEVLGELGQGAMGMVYKARDPKIHRMVAIKTIRFSDEFEGDRVLEVKERFFKEAELAGKLNHPAIISIYDVGEDYDLTYIAMELLDGTDLEHFCRQETLLPIRRVLDIIAETADALDYAHQNNVIHRDIKPANIMLLGNGRIKVTDFGIAKAVSSSQTKTGIILGTPNYMSPEQINGLPIDGRSDIFSLGVVFYQLLTGDLPFRGKTLTELFYQITQAKHPSPRRINPRVIKPCEQLIDRALEKEPSKRFQRAADFARYLRLLAEKMDNLKKTAGT
jgi:serine/threonine-protein kinase